MTKEIKTKYPGVIERHGKKDVTYVIRPTVNGKSKTISIGKKSQGYTAEDAYEHLKKINGVVDDGVIIKGRKNKVRVVDTDIMNLDQLSRKYFKMKWEEATKEEGLSFDQKKAKLPINIRKEESLYKNFWGNFHLRSVMKLAVIKESQVADYLLIKLTGKDGKKYSEKSIDNAVALIKSIIKHTGYRSFHPFGDIKKYCTPDKKTTRERFLSPAEMQLLIHEGKKELNQQNYLLIMTSLFTGARPDSVIHLKTKDVDWKSNKITFYDFKRKMYYTRQLPSKLKILLLPFLDNKRKFVFFSNRTKGEKAMCSEFPEAIGDLFDKLFNYIKGEERVVPYTLRHTYANTLLQVKHMPIEKVSYMLNHANIQTTVKNYIHMIDENVKEADISDMFDEEIDVDITEDEDVESTDITEEEDIAV